MRRFRSTAENLSSPAYNQTKGGDFNDWYSPGTQAPQVQDAVGTPGATPNLGTELTVLDVMGYTLMPGVIGGFKPDLAPDALVGWSSPLVVTTVKNSVTDSPTLTTADTLFLDAAVRNVGEFGTTTTETNVITLDGKTIFTFTDAAGLAVNNAYFSVGLSLGKLSAGSHTIKITADSTNTVSEIIENNNTFTRTFTVKAAVTPLPDWQPYTPTGWSAAYCSRYRRRREPRTPRRSPPPIRCTWISPTPTRAARR